ncbi:hypothetical protein C8R46DRAFT_882009, partial [Mycena filopes]
LCVTSTGDGKLALFAVLILVLLKVAKNSGLYPGFEHQKRNKSVRFMIAPTKGLAANIVRPRETLTDARKAGCNIAAKIVSCHWFIVCIDPEHLMDKQWEFITNCQEFQDNIFFASVDKCHLIDKWGWQIMPIVPAHWKFCKGPPSPHVSLSALTATLNPGAATKTVCKGLGFQTGIKHKTIIYCATIEICWCVYIFLLRLLPPWPRRLTHIHLYRAMCWLEENEKTMALMCDDPMCQIIVSTIVFGQGIHVKTLLDSIQLGVAKTVAQTVRTECGGGDGGKREEEGKHICLWHHHVCE